MPRRARKKSSSGIYHIIMRGINRKTIFVEQNDGARFIKTLSKYKDKCGYIIYAYCLMPNHIHLLIKVGNEPLEQVMRRICGSYVYWYNRKYQRIGNLFQDRFRSEAVEDDSYFLTVMRYIHQNPVKAGLVKKADDYRWSSFREYTNKQLLIDTDFVLKLFAPDRDKAVKSLIQFCNTLTDDRCLEIDEKCLLTDAEAMELIMNLFQITNILELLKYDKALRNLHLRQLKEEHHLSVRRIERLTGLNRGIIQNA